ncbi:MAG: chemotaxis protein CheX [Deltaproteobacteria bacterium]|nr:chemotaxis protein CheX [Deltaproteobacteria bacterium]
MSNGTSASQWLDAVLEASKELATTMLGMDEATFIEEITKLPDNEEAAYIALVGEETAVQVGIGASPENSMLVARALMGMEPDEPDLEEDEVADAISEIVNILGGQVKNIMSDHANVNLGLPMFMHGKLYVKESTDIKIAKIKLGEIPILILVLKSD